jgi:hypothetical protein
MSHACDGSIKVNWDINDRYFKQEDGLLMFVVW